MKRNVFHVTGYFQLYYDAVSALLGLFHIFSWDKDSLLWTYYPSRWCEGIFLVYMKMNIYLLSAWKIFQTCVHFVLFYQQYRATGRGFVVQHIKFADNYRLYSRSHFVKA